MSFWNHVRRLVINKEKYTCHRCGRVTKLVVHHKKYPAENLNDFVALCRSCHTKIHQGDVLSLPRENLIKAKRRMVLERRLARR